MSGLFHCLVVCGAGIMLLQCGGRAQVPGDEPTNSGAGGSTGGRSSSAQGGVAAVGGTLSLGGAVSTGGTLDLGGSFDLGGSTSTAGSFAVGGTFGAGGSFGSFGGTSAWPQWDCSVDNLHGCISGQNSELVFALGSQCTVNPSRPTSAKDCAAGQVFSCLLGELNGETGAVNCACLPLTPGMSCPCPPGKDYYTTVPRACTNFQVQCGCDNQGI